MEGWLFVGVNRIHLRAQKIDLITGLSKNCSVSVCSKLSFNTHIKNKIIIH